MGKRTIFNHKKRDLKAFQKEIILNPEDPLDQDSDTGIDPESVSLEEDFPQPTEFKGCMLAEMFNSQTDPTGYFISEKLDGVRCIWNGEKMISRNGKGFNPPDYFLEKFPKGCVLDGELFSKGASFQKRFRLSEEKNRMMGGKI